MEGCAGGVEIWLEKNFLASVTFLYALVDIRHVVELMVILYCKQGVKENINKCDPNSRDKPANK